VSQDDVEEDSLLPSSEAPLRSEGKHQSRIAAWAPYIFSALLLVNLVLAIIIAVSSHRLSSLIENQRTEVAVANLPRPDPLVGLPGHPTPPWSSFEN